MSRSYRIVMFDQQSPPVARDIAMLHRHLLAHSPVALLGDEFMERFYYSILPREGLIFGAVAYVDDKPAGFAVATHDSAGFMRTALRRGWRRLGVVIGLSILVKPTRIAALWEAWRIMSTRPRVESTERQGEAISLGVLPEYRGPRFVRETGLRISVDLMRNTLSQLRARGVRAVRTIIDADNTPSKLFHQRFGWTLARRRVPGWRTPSEEFVLHLDKQEIA
jgi:ribosomal protein S18 acetylase RimI-like enzyme